MKLTKTVPTGLPALIVSLVVTVGSIYVTVSAAATNATPSNVVESPEAPALEAEPASIKAAGTSIPLTADGTLTGRFSSIDASGELQPAKDLVVTLTSSTGTKTAATTDDQGFCSFEDVSPGIYTVVADSPQGKLSYGIRTSIADFAVAASEPQPVAIDRMVAIDSVLTPKSDQNAISHVIKGVEVKAVVPDPAAAPKSATPTENAGQTENSYAHEPIQLNADGSLEGRLNLLDPATGDVGSVNDLTVSLIIDNSVVANARVNPDGTFTLWNLLPGVYSMVVAGQDGIAYMGVQFAGDPVPDFADGIPTAVRKQETPFSMSVVQGAGADEPSDEEPEGQGEEGTTPPAGGAAAGGGGSTTGGGGGGGSGGGFGELLGLAGAALGAAALASDDDGTASPGN